MHKFKKWLTIILSSYIAEYMYIAEIYSDTFNISYLISLFAI